MMTAPTSVTRSEVSVQDAETVDPVREAFVAAAAWLQNTVHSVKPGVEQWSLVLTVRHDDAVVAFQCFGRRLD